MSENNIDKLNKEFGEILKLIKNTKYYSSISERLVFSLQIVTCELINLKKEIENLKNKKDYPVDQGAVYNANTR